jgi:hypothetical protein
MTTNKDALEACHHCKGFGDYPPCKFCGKMEEKKVGYIPFDIAYDCLNMLKPFERKGEPNTLFDLVKYVTEQLAALTPATPERIELFCPECGQQHVDKGEWATREHKTHLCEFCKHEWRPFEHPTFGVIRAKEAMTERKDGLEDYQIGYDQGVYTGDVSTLFVRKGSKVIGFIEGELAEAVYSMLTAPRPAQAVGEDALKFVENTLYYIANDQIELSHDKVRNQRDDYIVRALEALDKLIEAKEAGHLEVKG